MYPLMHHPTHSSEDALFLERFRTALRLETKYLLVTSGGCPSLSLFSLSDLLTGTPLTLLSAMNVLRPCSQINLESGPGSGQK